MKNTIWMASAVAVLGAVLGGCAMSVDTDSATGANDELGSVEQALEGTIECPNGETRTALDHILPFDYVNHMSPPDACTDLKATSTCSDWRETCRNSAACKVLHDCMAGIAADGSYQGIFHPAKCNCLTSESLPGTAALNAWIGCIYNSTCVWDRPPPTPSVGAIDRCGFFC